MIKKFQCKDCCKKTAIIFGIAFASIAVMVNFIFKPDFTYLTQTINYTYEDVISLFQQIGVTGKRIHLLVLIADVFMTILYTGFFMATLALFCHSFLSNRINVNSGDFTRGMRIFILSPFALFAIQGCEIIGMFFLLTLSSISPVYVTVLNAITITKSILTTLFFIAMLIIYILIGVKRFVPNPKGA